MKTRHRSIPSFRLILAMGIMAGASLAAADLDLERIAPVPAGEVIPIQDFFRPAYFTNPQLNPAGTHVAALVSGGFDKYKLMVVDLATNELGIMTGIGDMDVYRFSWLNDERLNFSMSADKYWGIGLGAVNLGALNRPYSMIQYGRHELIGVPHDSRTRPLAWVSGEGRGKDGGIVVLNSDIKTDGFVDLNRANVGSADYSFVEDSNRKHVMQSFPVPEGGIPAGYFSDRNGGLAYSYTARDGLFTLHAFNGEDWTPTPLDMEKYHVQAVGNDRSELIVQENLYDGQPSALRLVKALTGEVGGEILRDKGYDFEGLIYRDPATREVAGAMFDRATPAVVWFDPAYAELQKIFDGYFPKKIVRIVSGSETGTNFVLRVSSDREPASYFVVDLKKKSLGPLKSSRPWIDPERMLGMSIIKYKTAEGMRLDAYLTLPKGASKTSPVPLIVLPHGGPWVRDTWGFDSQAQFLASRGYAVLQPNYRGSPGYDWMFPEPDQYDFIKMHEDVTAATQTALRTGLFDATRVAIMGGSFGAYLALSGAVHEPDLYKCVVGMAGVYDWREVLLDEARDQHSSPEFGRLKLKLGDPDKGAEKFRRISPIHFVENMRAPMFVAHGKDDKTASILESRRLVKQLEKYGVKHETLFVAREGHGMGNLENQVELFERVEAFLAKNL